MLERNFTEKTMKKHTCLIVTLAPIVTWGTLNAIDAEQVQKVQNYQETDVYIEEGGVVDEQDIWFGPGFYYGIWFDAEPDYWEWRRNHWDYPPNRYYYDHDHPVEYHRDGSGRYRGYDRGGENRGGDDFRGGGGHGGGHGGGGHR